MEITDFITAGILNDLRLGMSKADVLMDYYPDMVFRAIAGGYEISDFNLFEITLGNSSITALRINVNLVFRYYAEEKDGGSFLLHERTSLERYVKFLTRNDIAWEIDRQFSLAQQVAVRTTPGTIALFAYDERFYLRSIFLGS